MVLGYLCVGGRGKERRRGWGEEKGEEEGVGRGGGRGEVEKRREREGEIGNSRGRRAGSFSVQLTAPWHTRDDVMHAC